MIRRRAPDLVICRQSSPPIDPPVSVINTDLPTIVLPNSSSLGKNGDHQEQAGQHNFLNGDIPQNPNADAEGIGYPNRLHAQQDIEQ